MDGKGWGPGRCSIMSSDNHQQPRRVSRPLNEGAHRKVAEPVVFAAASSLICMYCRDHMICQVPCSPAKKEICVPSGVLQGAIEWSQQLAIAKTHGRHPTSNKKIQPGPSMDYCSHAMLIKALSWHRNTALAFNIDH